MVRCWPVTLFFFFFFWHGTSLVTYFTHLSFLFVIATTVTPPRKYHSCFMLLLVPSYQILWTRLYIFLMEDLCTHRHHDNGRLAGYIYNNICPIATEGKNNPKKKKKKKKRVRIRGPFSVKGHAGMVQ